MNRDLSGLLTSLSDANAKIVYRSLIALSDLDRQELQVFQTAWATFAPALRRELLAALAELAEEHVEYDFRAIFRWALADADPAIRVLAIDGLWEDDSPQLLPHYLRLLQDAEAPVRAAAALALGRVCYWSECGDIPEAPGESAAAALWDVYQQPQEALEVRRRALEGLAVSCHPQVDQAIKQAYYDGETLLRASALYAMGRSADPRWIPFLLPELRQPQPELRLEAARALGDLEARAAVQPLLEMMVDEPDLEVLLAAIAALSQIGGAKARRALEALTGSDNEALADAAVTALDEFSDITVGDFALIAEVLGLGEEGEEDEDEEKFPWEDDYEEDPLEAEIRRLMNERDA
ncbi:MAG: HEAT repeat domain-containing protein [Caldilineales bacterium]|nr:HEAT repeat domain-containing protein [Caldilineales bacterium]